MPEQIRKAEDLRGLVRQERRRRRLTQAKAAGLIGRTQKWLSDFEAGRTDPPLSAALDMLALVGVRLTATLTTRRDLSEGLPEDEIELDPDEGL